MKYTVENLRDKCIIDKNGCWIWTAPNKAGQTPSLAWEGSTRTVAKIIFELAYDFQLDQTDLVDHVTHECGNSICMNPAHMSVTTSYKFKGEWQRIYLRGLKRYTLDMGTCVHGHPIGDGLGHWRMQKLLSQTKNITQYARLIYCHRCALAHSNHGRNKPKEKADWGEKARLYLDSV